MKKGAINLSINMIIVLIIAIVILGFALSFITDLFAETEEKFTGLFPTIEVPVNSDSPIGIGEQFKITDGTERQLTLKIFNNKAGTVETSTTSKPTISCSSGTAPTVERIGTVSVGTGQVDSVKLVVKGGIGMTNNDICTISFDLTGSDVDPNDNKLEQDFFLVTN